MKFYRCPICSLTWVGSTFVRLLHHLAQPILPNAHQPTQNWADSETIKIQINPTWSTSRWDILYTAISKMCLKVCPSFGPRFSNPIELNCHQDRPGQPHGRRVRGRQQHQHHRGRRPDRPDRDGALHRPGDQSEQPHLVLHPEGGPERKECWLVSESCEPPKQKH